MGAALRAPVLQASHLSPWGHVEQVRLTPACVQCRAQRVPHSGAGLASLLQVCFVAGARPCSLRCPTSPLAQPHNAWKALRRGPEMLSLCPVSAPSPTTDPCLGTAAGTGSAPVPLERGLRRPHWPALFLLSRLCWLPHLSGRAWKGMALGPVLQGMRGRRYLSTESGRGDRNTCASEEFRPALDTISVTTN